ncbi:ATP synthase subunit C lysine N-methyltransferase-like [Montipora capricornis]|uniref:ATP synthase subunit C lysine N-methyltransferase-like n=1 Tax=Montipora capricornis TaxID=246305 RepID=UPI0035F10611
MEWELSTKEQKRSFLVFLFDTLESSLCYALATFICPQLCKLNSPVFFRGMDSESHLIELQEDNKIPKKSSKFGKVVVGITGGTALGIALVNVPFVTQALRKIFLSYVPATERQVANITKPAKTSKRQRSTMVDLGSGHGRVVFAAARHGYQRHGYKLNHWLVWYSKLQARLQGLHKKDNDFPEMTCGRLNSPTWTLL